MNNEYIGNLYVYSDAENMGYLLEYVNEFAIEKYGKEICVEKFIDSFMKSHIRSLMDGWHPRLMSQAAVDTFMAYVEVDLHDDLSSIEGENKYGYNDCELMWIGMTYAILKNKLHTNMIEVYKYFSLEDMKHLYICGHQLETYDAAERLCQAQDLYKKFQNKKRKTDKKEYIDLDGVEV